MNWDIPKDLLCAVPDTAIPVSVGGSWLESLSLLWETAREQAGGIIRNSLGGMTSILLIVIAAAMLESMFLTSERKNSQYIAMAAGAAILLSALGDVNHLMGLGEETILNLEQFSKVLLPILAAATASMGHAGSAAVRQVSTVLVSDLLLTLVSRFLLPLIRLHLAALAAGSLFSDQRLKAVAGCIRKGIVWLLGGILTLFTGYLSVMGAIVGSVDAAALRTAKRAVTSAVPVVGGILSAVTETVLAGAGMLKNSIGIFGVLVLCAICIVPFLHIGVQYLLFKLTAFLACTIASPVLSELINGISSVFALMLAAVGSCAVVLLVSLISSLLVVIR